MAQDENDMSGEAAFAGESAATRKVRSKFENVPISATELADAIAKAQQRVMEDAGKVQQKPLPAVVRASVRCGMETVRQDKGDGGYKIVTQFGSMDFTGEETGDGKPARVPHGRPVKLKREAFLKYQSLGKVVLAE